MTNIKSLSFLIVILTLSIFSVHAQSPERLDAAQIFHKIQKLNFLGSVLYVGAHPDDENTRLISYFSNNEKARIAYLSLTRGDGGQNLIGTELREQLGVIRTQELLAARRLDGGSQIFTRANDFGYSKNPEETLRIWDKDLVLNDVVYAIRKFKPDVIINRFDHRTPGSTHGHHTSSAILSVEAYDIANDETKYSEISKLASPFQPKRLFFNTSPWFYANQEAFEAADKSNFMQFDIGVYYPLRGLSNTEIAALSRSQHQSQGFGSTGTRGSQLEYLELIKGDYPSDGHNIFDGIDTSWNRLENGDRIKEVLSSVEKDYDFKDPAASLPKLVEAYKLIQNLTDEHWRIIKIDEIKEIIAAVSGLYLEAVVSEPSATPGDVVSLKLEAINRSENPVKLSSVIVRPNNSSIQVSKDLEDNLGWSTELNLEIPSASPFTSPYWLNEEGSIGMYTVTDKSLIGLPETPPYTLATFNLDIFGTQISFDKPIVYKTNDPVLGELYQPFQITPPVSMTFNEEVVIFTENKPKDIFVSLKAWKDNVSGKISLRDGAEWKAFPDSREFKIAQKGESIQLKFTVQPPKSKAEAYLQPTAIVDGKQYSKGIIQIDYQHIPLQTLLLPSQLKAVKLNIEKKGNNIGYIVGAGDLIPEGLNQIGYNVSEISTADISLEALLKYDAVILGIRAFNILEDLKYKQEDLFEYVRTGGNLIVQYNTSRSLVTNRISPFELKLSRDRVTDESANVEFLAADHSILNYPNKITKADFDGWVQERGLYFPESWSAEFTPILSMNDPGETAKNGSLLVAKYGKGYYIYTGLSFFREFPAGVSGAYRLFTNMISIGK